MMKLIIVLAIIAVTFWVTVRYVESHSLYFPMKEVTSNPNMVDVPYEDANFYTADGKKLNGWFIAVPGQNLQCFLPTVTRAISARGWRRYAYFMIWG